MPLNCVDSSNLANTITEIGFPPFHIRLGQCVTPEVFNLLMSDVVVKENDQVRRYLWTKRTDSHLTRGTRYCC